MTGNSALQELFDVCGAAELVADGVKMTATQLHHGADDWSRALRRAGIARGDRVVCALPNGAAFAQLLVAALADGVTLAPVPPDEDVGPLLDALDARIAIAVESTHPHVATPSRTGGPPNGPMEPRRATERTDAVAFLLRSSGTTGVPRWIALSDAGVLAVLESHLPFLGIDGASTLCVLPWHHAFGLILGLLPALLRARRIVTATNVGRDTTSMIAVVETHAVDHMNMVPLTASRLGTSDEGRRILQVLNGGLVGGAPIDAAAAAVLSSTRLRIGYGQTEAGPGIMLSHPGEFRPMLLGRPIGCDVRMDDDGVLAFRGANACIGFWQNAALTSLDPDRWHRTDDIVTVSAGVYSFVGRTSMTFKLANGRLVAAPALERAIRERITRITDVVLMPRGGEGIDILYSTFDALPVDDAAIRDILGGLGKYIHRTQCVGTDDWFRSSKGEIDRRRLPALR